MADMRLQALPDILQDLLPCGRFFNVAVDALLDENLLQAGKMPLLLEFLQLNLQLGP